MALSTLGIDHITVPAKVLQALADDRDVKTFRGEDMDVSAPDSRVKPKQSAKGESYFELIVADEIEPHSRDFLADDGKALDESIAADESVGRRLASALKWVHRSC